MTVADRIISRRKELGLSQEDLAKKMGFASKTSISKTEAMGDNVSTKKIRLFAEHLNCSVAYLMGWEDNSQVQRLNAYCEKLSKLSEDNRKLVEAMIDKLS
jgi:transcriptional regulator with XRE-family HTH domain